MEKHELWWVAGLLEGEGSFCLTAPKPSKPQYRYPQVEINMCDLDVLERFVETVGIGNKISGPHRTRSAHHRPTYGWRVAGQNAAWLMVQVLPLMGERRAAKIREVLEVTGWSTDPV